MRIISAFSLGILITWLLVGGLNAYSRSELSLNYLCGEANGYNRGYNAGYYTATANNTENITEYVEVEKIVEVPVEVITEIIRIEYVDREVYKGARYFESLEELTSWLAQDDTDSHLILTANADGVCFLNGACEDYAMQLQLNALTDGFILSTEIEKYKYLDCFTLPEALPETDHIFNLAIIPLENAYYWIEPQTDEIHYWGKLD